MARAECSGVGGGPVNRRRSVGIGSVSDFGVEVEKRGVQSVEWRGAAARSRVQHRRMSGRALVLAALCRACPAARLARGYQ